MCRLVVGNRGGVSRDREDLEHPPNFLKCHRKTQETGRKVKLSKETASTEARRTKRTCENDLNFLLSQSERFR